MCDSMLYYLTASRISLINRLNVKVHIILESALLFVCIVVLYNYELLCFFTSHYVIRSVLYEVIKDA
jgi:hypothetical protein